MARLIRALAHTGSVGLHRCASWTISTAVGRGPVVPRVRPITRGSVVRSDPMRVTAALFRVRPTLIALSRFARPTLIVVSLGLATAAVFADAGIAQQRRLDAVERDLAVASLMVGEDALRPQGALTEFGSDMDTILAAINGKADVFAREFKTFRELFPSVRGLHVATRPGATVALVGDAALLGPFERTEVNSFCSDGHGYAVLLTGIGRRGFIALAYDPIASMDRAREATGQRVRLSLVERSAPSTLVVDGRAACGSLEYETVYKQAAEGKYDARIEDEGDAVAYTPILGTTFALVAEQAPPRDELLPLLRRGLLLVGVALTAALAWLRRARTSRDPDTGRARSRS